MADTPIEVRQTRDYARWFDGLRDVRARARILIPLPIGVSKVNKRIVSYGTFERKIIGDGETHWVATAPTIEALKQTLLTFQNNSVEDDKDLNTVTIDIESAVGRGIWSFYSQLKSYYEVVAFVDTVPRVFSTRFFDDQIKKYAVDNFAVADRVDDISIYELDDIGLSYVNRAMEKWNALSSGLGKLPSSVLLSMVAGFDSAFADFAKTLLKSKPERYSGSDRQYSVSEILKLESLEQIINKAAEDEIDTLMNKSHGDQISFFEKGFGISIKEHYERWPNFIEIFERRNLAAHGSLTVNERYLENCKSVGLKPTPVIGDKLKVDAEYLQQAIDILIEFGMLLALSAWQKQYPKSILETFGAVVEVSYSLLKDKHPAVAARLLQYGLRVKSKGADEEKVKMMTINFPIAYKLSGNICLANDLLASTDWSASPPQFKLCAAAIKEEISVVCSLMDAARVSDNMSLLEIREWPAFHWVRNHEDFRSKCQSVFGEPLYPVRTIASGNVATITDDTDK